MKSDNPLTGSAANGASTLWRKSAQAQAVLTVSNSGQIERNGIALEALSRDELIKTVQELVSLMMRQQAAITESLRH